MVEVEKLSLAMGRGEVLSDISFRLEAGTITVVLGRNGSGKTSLIRCLCSFYRNYGGTIRYGGKNIESYPMNKRQHLHSLLPQSVPSVDICLNQLLSYAVSSSRTMDAGAVGRIEDTIKFLGLEEFSFIPVSRMSGGERQLSFLAFMAARNSIAYYLDEPEASLDESFKLKAEAVMAGLRDEGKVVFSSMHDINRALGLADRILVLEKGRLVFDGSPSRFIEEDCGNRYFSLVLKNMTDDEGGRYHLYL